MTGERLMRRIAEAFEQGDLRPLFAAIDDRVMWKSGATAAGPFCFGGIYRRRLGIVKVTSEIAAGYHFRKFRPTDISTSGDIVWGLFDVEGDYKPPHERPGSGRPFKMEIAVRWRLRGEKIIEHQGFFDTNSLLRQQAERPILSVG